MTIRGRIDSAGRLEDEAARLARVADLASGGAFAEAEALCRVDRDASDQLLRMRGYILQELGRHDEAIDCYQHILDRNPGDFESWNNLGNARLQTGDMDGSVAALERARNLRPDLAPIDYNLGAAYAAAGRLEEARAALSSAVRGLDGSPAPLLALGRVLGRLDRNAEALELLYRALRLAPRSADLHIEAAFQAAQLGDPETGERHCREALRLEPGSAAALSSLGTFLESSNRFDELRRLLEEADDRRMPKEAFALLRTQLLRHEGRLEDALAMAETIPDEPDPARKQQLISDLADRSGDTKRAFAGFTEMNRLMMAEKPQARADAGRYRADVTHVTALATRGWFETWRQPTPSPATQASPIFLVGFPRSGTTLLNTVLSGHSALHVLEEQPVLEPVIEMLGGDERLPHLSDDEIADLRTRYFRELERVAPDAADKTIVDKMPLYIRQAPLLHRLFPHSRWIFVERHPCDVVLSCYMTRFRLNAAMANFLDLEDAASLYDATLGCWQRCRAVFPLHVHTVRYEAMVDNMKAAVRPLFDFLDIGWEESVLDHGRSAKERGYIRTASYAQVAEPTYKRASGRWRRYREQLAGVLPVLEPWANKMGYDI